MSKALKILLAVFVSLIGIFIIAAILTPPDVFTQVALALPIIMLYEIGLIFAVKKRQRGKLEG